MTDADRRRLAYQAALPLSAKGKAAIRKSQDFYRGYPKYVAEVTAPTPLERCIKTVRCFD